MDDDGAPDGDALGDGRDGDGNEGDGKDGDDGEGKDGDGSDGGGNDVVGGIGGAGSDGEPLPGMAIGFGIRCCWDDGKVTTQPANTKPKTAASAPVADCLIDRFKFLDERKRLGRLIAISLIIQLVPVALADPCRGGLRTNPILQPRRRDGWRRRPAPWQVRHQGSHRWGST